MLRIAVTATAPSASTAQRSQRVVCHGARPNHQMVVAASAKNTTAITGTGVTGCHSAANEKNR
jgi:hypothetical protein